jgi:hypothetical protein
LKIELSAQFSPKPVGWPESLLKKKRGGEGQEKGKEFGVERSLFGDQTKGWKG